ncbi:MAG: photosynthetic complex assembly protein PuhC [Pseudomonadota bacterium]
MPHDLSHSHTQIHDHSHGSQPHAHDIPVPKGMLIGAGLLVASVIAFTAVSSATGFGQIKTEIPVAAEQISINFFDEEDGGIGVYSAASGEALRVYEPGTGHFVRTAVRSLAATREKAGIDKTPPFELMRTVEGRIVLYDPSTETFLALRAFGQGNAADFEQLLAAVQEGEDI